MKTYTSPQIQVVEVSSKEMFAAYSGCLADTFYAVGRDPICTGNTPDRADGDCWYTPSA